MRPSTVHIVEDEPFHSGLTVVFGAAAVMMLIGALASLFNPGRYGTEPGADNAS